MNKQLYSFYELLKGEDVLPVGKIAETVNLGNDNFKLWFNPSTYELEYYDYPEQVVKIIAAQHKDFPETTDEQNEEVLFRIIY